MDSLKGQAIAKQLRDAVDEIQTKIGKKIFEGALRWVGCICTDEWVKRWGGGGQGVDGDMY